MYNKVSSDLNFVAREKEIKKFWDEHHIFEKSIENRKNCEPYTFYDGPPTANGKPHIGHVLTRVIKDMIPRYRTMKGYMVPRKAGWDTHGLPVELEVEKLLGLDGKEQIEKYGLEPFIDHCKESVWKYKGMWEDFSKTVGFWADMENPYVTYHNEFIESEWWALKQIWEKGLLYKGFKIVPYCPRCGTPLSSHEVAQGYKTVKERSAIVRFRVKGENAYFLAWTTTPWTLPSNTALCVNPQETYVKVNAADGYTYYLAEALLDRVLGSLAEEGKPAYEVVKRYTGSDLESREYEPLFACAGTAAEKQEKKAHFVTCDSYVTMTDGTGIVHIAPAFGEDDARIGRNYDLPFIQFVNGKGEMTADTPYEGQFVKDADPVILKDLDREGKLFSAPKFEHDYPFCWRCDTPLIYYARESWFIKMTAVREDLIRNNNTINWIPESIGKGRFGDWLQNVQDWGISRNRYWGTPLNIWQCGCGHMHAIGSIEELKSMSDNCPEDIELHRPYIDAVTLRCPECGGEMHRVPEVIDCWFDSGAMPFAQLHYPFENKELFETQFPADFISEAVDQTRGWFNSLLAISTLIFNKAPYKNVIVLGHVQDENGQKMSKSKGNAVDPFEALEKHGADAIRWYFYSNSAPWLPNRFHSGAVIEGQRKLMGTLWNIYAFYVLYANIDNFDAAEHCLSYDSLSVLDKWLLSKLNTLIGEVDENLENYKITETARALQDFVDLLSNWYVRRSRERFWVKGMPQDKINAYMTLYTALVSFCKVAAPMLPFMTEDIYRNLVSGHEKNAPESIHLCDFPAANSDRELPDYFVSIITDELNVKRLSFVENTDEYASYVLKPQLKTCGPKFGKHLGELKEKLASLNGSAAVKDLHATGGLKLTLGGEEAVLTSDDLLISSSQDGDYEVCSDSGITVVLDKRLSPELLEEGFVREIVSKVQTMRKDAGFEVLDQIDVYVSGSEKIQQILEKNAKSIKKDVLCRAFVFSADSSVSMKDWNINGERVSFGVKKIG